MKKILFALLLFLAPAIVRGQIVNHDVTLPTTLTAPGVFTNMQMNENWSVVVGAVCTPSSIFTATQRGNFGTDAVSGTICVPSSGVNNGFSSGIHGYAAVSGPSTGCAFGPCSGVAVSGDALDLTVGSAAFGANFVVQSTLGNVAVLNGEEIDVNAENTGDSGVGLKIFNLGGANPTANFPAIAVQQGMAPFNHTFTAGLLCNPNTLSFNGSTVNGDCVSVKEQQSGASQKSNFVTFYETDSGNTEHAFSLGTLSGTTAILGLTTGWAPSKIFTIAAGVNQLPAANSVATGTQLIVSDATTFTVGTCTGGGSDFMIAISNGSTWSCH